MPTSAHRACGGRPLTFKEIFLFLSLSFSFLLAAATPTFGQMSASVQRSHCGRRAVQMRRPCWMSAWLIQVQRSFGMIRLRSRSAFTASVWRVQPRRRARRPTCVSTTTPSGVPQTFPRTTFAVLRPTPGRARRASIVRGTSPPCFRHEGLRHAAEGLRLRVEEARRPDDLLERSGRRRREGRDVREAPEELRRHLVDARVGALRRENGRNEELERAPEIERARGVPVQVLEPLQRQADGGRVPHVSIRHFRGGA